MQESDTQLLVPITTCKSICPVSQFYHVAHMSLNNNNGERINSSGV